MRPVTCAFRACCCMFLIFASSSSFCFFTSFISWAVLSSYKWRFKSNNHWLRQTQSHQCCLCPSNTTCVVDHRILLPRSCNWIETLRLPLLFAFFVSLRLCCHLRLTCLVFSFHCLLLGFEHELFQFVRFLYVRLGLIVHLFQFLLQLRHFIVGRFALKKLLSSRLHTAHQITEFPRKMNFFWAFFCR